MDKQTNAIPTASLKPGHADRIIAGHPWVFEKSIQRLTKEPEDGEIVQVKDSRKRFVGIGFYNSRCRVRIRMASSERETIDRKWFESRIRAALAYRVKHLPECSCFRVVNAESDFLGGLIVDKFEDTLAVQISSLAFDQRRAEILGALEAVFPNGRIVENFDAGFRKFEGLPESATTTEIADEQPRLDVTINDIRFQLDFHSGHKTGAYLDQQFNYQAVGRIVSRLDKPRVLDCFSYEGGFALQAGRNGAAEVVGLEQNEDAVARANANAETNGLSEVCRFEAVNVFDWFKEATRKDAGEKPFDMIILDPPSFTRSRANLDNAARGYKEIHLRALRLLKRGGILTTFSCSHHVHREFFLDVIREAAFDARRSLRIVEIHEQAPDHPILPFVPETEYLKGFSLEVVS